MGGVRIGLNLWEPIWATIWEGTRQQFLVKRALWPSQEQGIASSVPWTVKSEEFIALVLSSVDKPSGKYSGKAKISGLVVDCLGLKPVWFVRKSLALCTSIFSCLLGASFSSSDLQPVCYSVTIPYRSHVERAVSRLGYSGCLLLRDYCQCLGSRKGKVLKLGFFHILESYLICALHGCPPISFSISKELLWNRKMQQLAAFYNKNSLFIPHYKNNL